MKKPMVRIYTEKDVFIDREMTDEEYAQYLKDLDTFAKVKETEAKAETEKAALLAKLGITADEAKLLLS